MSGLREQTTDAVTNCQREVPLGGALSDGNICIGSVACNAVCTNRPDANDGTPISLGEQSELDPEKAQKEWHDMTRLPDGATRTGIESAIGALEQREERLWEAVRVLSDPNKTTGEKKAAVESTRPPVEFDLDEGLNAGLVEVLAQAIRTSRNGELYLDEPMREIALQGALNLSLGRHLLFVGDPGVAKTQMAVHLAETIDPDYTFLSLSSGRNDTLIEKQEITDGSTVDTLGVLSQAAQDGKVLVIEEFNSIPPEDQAQLNTILMAKPGDTVTLSSGTTMTIGEGFRVIATLNPSTNNQGHTRQHTFELGDALKARFTTTRFLPSMLHLPSTEGDIPDTSTLEVLILSKAVKHGGVAAFVETMNKIDGIEATLRSVYDLQRAAQSSNEHAAKLPPIVSDRDVVRWFEEWYVQSSVGLDGAGNFNNYVMSQITLDPNNQLTSRYREIFAIAFGVNT